MGPIPSSILSEFETEEQAVSYDRWFRARVQASLEDPRPAVSHQRVMARIDAIIETARRRQQDPQGGES
ncbi:MAG: stability determinant [Achromobacter xylosoxidans]|nr:stability determinant [Achromobacter xylosoxidans]